MERNEISADYFERQRHRVGSDGTEHLCVFDCGGSIHPGKGRGYPPERQDLIGQSYVVRPAKHVGHTVTVIAPYGVSITPSYQPGLKHRVRCSCGDEWDMLDSTIVAALPGFQAGEKP